MAMIPQMSIRQPLPGDLVDDPIQISGLGTAFEGQFFVRARDGNGTIVGEAPVQAGGTGLWANFQTVLPLGRPPATPEGRLIVFELVGDDGGPVVRAAVPVVFGSALLPAYAGFTVYTVERGDTLSGIARQFYGDSSMADVLFEANRDRIEDPDRLTPGQELRVPQSFEPGSAPGGGGEMMEPQATGGNAGNVNPPPINQCGNWSAWLDLMPGDKPTLHVTGQCTFPSLGYQVELQRAVPQGVNPEILLLRKVVTPPPSGGVTGSQVETLDVRYREQPAQNHYKQVQIEPDGVLLDVQEVH